MIINAEYIAKALGKAVRAGAGWNCCCPAHDDENPSLTVTDITGGGVMVYCHAGCFNEKVIDILKELGLWPKTNKSEVTYDYVDANDKLLYQVVRSKDKKFSQRRSDGNGDWIWDVKGVEKVPYKLPKLLATIKEGKPIFVAEGEKDCDNLASLGLTATTNSGGGTSKWNDQLSEYFKDAKEVFIFPDNDEVGYKHSNEVAISLYKLSLPIKVIPLPGLPEKGDVSDWLHAGGTAEQLLQLCADAPLWSPDQYNNNLGEIVSISKNAKPDWTDPATFGDPILFGEIETPELTSEIFPSWIKDFLDALIEQTQTPKSMSVLLELPILATIIQKRFEVSNSSGDYIEPLSIWTATILPPANRKTAVLNALRQPIVEWEAAEAARLATIIDAANTEREIILKKIEDLKKQASRTYGETADKCSSRGDKCPEEIMKEIAMLLLKMPKPAIPPKLFVTDITPEALQNTLAENGERLAIISDEGNIFEIMAGLYSDGKTNIDVFLQGHAGGPLRVKRSNRDVHLDNIAVTVGLAVQPQVIKELKFGSKKSFRGKGVLPRFLFGWPKSNIGKRDIRNKKIMEPNIKQAYADGIKTLLQIPPAFNKENIETPRKLMLDNDALESCMQFSEWLEPELGEGGKYEYIQDWAGKLPGQCLRIAGLCHVASLVDLNSGALSALSTLSPEQWEKYLVISKATIEPVIDFCKKLIIHAQAVFDDLMEDNEAISDAKTTYKWIINNVEQDEKGALFIRQSVLHNARFSKSDAERVIKALDVLHGRNILSSHCQLPTAKPTYIRYVNPVLIVDQFKVCA